MSRSLLVVLLLLAVAGCSARSESPPPELAPPFPEAFDDFTIGVKIAEYESVLPGGHRAGLVVEFVRTGSLAEKGGMREGDAITDGMISVPDDPPTTSSRSIYVVTTRSRLAAFYRAARGTEGATSFGFGFFRGGREWNEVEFPIKALKPPRPVEDVLGRRNRFRPKRSPLPPG